MIFPLKSILFTIPNNSKSLGDVIDHEIEVHFYRLTLPHVIISKKGTKRRRLRNSGMKAWDLPLLSFLEMFCCCLCVNTLF